ncbi:hypothetical protein [Brevundimonas sp.]|uniref:hypothetical protein n=1 Tax=Brevundimonas sp. TaxID=1871086 RepID=UPI003F6FAFCA
MRTGLLVLTAALTASVGLTACYPAKIMQYDRPDTRLVLDRVRAGEADRAQLADGRTVDLAQAVTAGELICSVRLEPACLSAAQVVRLETSEAPDTPLWVYVVAAPLTPIVLANEAMEGLDRALTGGPQTYSLGWAANSGNPCLPFVQRADGGAWPSDQKIRADLYRRRAELDGACLMQLGREYAIPVPARRRLHLTGQIRARFEAFACARPRPEAEADAPRVFAPLGRIHTEGREVGWPRELAGLLDDPATWATSPALTQACTGAGGVAPDPAPAMARAREAWPIPSTGPAA